MSNSTFQYFLPDHVRERTSTTGDNLLLEKDVNSEVIIDEHTTIGDHGRSLYSISFNKDRKSKMHTTKVFKYTYQEDSIQCDVLMELREHNSQCIQRVFTKDFKTCYFVRRTYMKEDGRTLVEIFSLNFDLTSPSQIYEVAFADMKDHQGDKSKQGHSRTCIFPTKIAVLQHACNIKECTAILSPTNNKLIVIASGYDKLRRKNTSRFIDVLSLKPIDNSFDHEDRFEISEYIESYYSVDVRFNQSESALLLFSKGKDILHYSLRNHKLTQWSNNIEDVVFCDFIRCNYRRDEVIVLTQAGHISIFEVNDSTFELKKSLTINLGHLTNFEDVKLSTFSDKAFMIIPHKTELHVVDIDDQGAVKTFPLTGRTSWNVRVISGWSSEELFVYFSQQQKRYLKVFYNQDKRISLKHLARKTILQKYSQDTLNREVLPAALKHYLNAY